MFTKWSNELLTGNDVIDRQHRGIFERAEEMINSTSAGKTTEDPVVLVGYLEGYFQAHFAAEEALQLEYGDPNHVAHKKMHEKFRREVTQLKREISASGATYAMTIKTVFFMLEWLANHICKMDKDFAAHIRRVASTGPTPVSHLAES